MNEANYESRREALKPVRPAARRHSILPTRPHAFANAGLGRPNRLLHALRGCRGQSLIETAVAMPAFLLLLFGLIDFSVVLFDFENATYACRTAARYASLHSSTSLAPCTSAQVIAIAEQYLWAPTNSSTVKVNWPSGNVIGGTVTVSVSVAYRVGIPFSSLSSVTLGGSAQRTIMR